MNITMLVFATLSAYLINKLIGLIFSLFLPDKFWSRAIKMIFGYGCGLFYLYFAGNALSDANSSALLRIVLTFTPIVVFLAVTVIRRVKPIEE